MIANLMHVAPKEEVAKNRDCFKMFSMKPIKPLFLCWKVQILNKPLAPSTIHNYFVNDKTDEY
jgi:hypothetical protein